MLQNILLLFIAFQLNTIELPFNNSTITIDGNMEQSWKNAYLIDTLWTELAPNFNEQYDDSCKVYITYNSNNMFIFLKVFQNPNTFTELNGIRDQGGDRDDITICIDPMGNKQEVYYINIGLPDVIIDFRESRSNNRYDITWNSNVNYAVLKTDYGYNIELQIPFSDFRRKDNNMIWNMNFYRTTKYNKSQGVLFPFAEITQEERYASMRAFSLPKAKSKREKLEIMPYSFYGTDFENNDIKNAGFDMKLPIKTNSVFNFAFNPDFNQLEGDPISIDFNSRYETYYREYRPLFTEEKNVFYTADEIFYSRAIKNPYTAAKYTYKNENNQLGIIFTYDKYDSIIDNQNQLNGILRFSKQFFNNLFGLYIVNNYNIDSLSNNTIIEHDGNIYFFDKINLSYIYAISSVFNNGFNKDNIDFKDYFLKLNLNYQIQDFSLNIQSKAINNDYSNELGYIEENNKFKNELDINKTIRINNPILNMINFSQGFEISDNLDNIKNISLFRDSLSHTEYTARSKLVMSFFNSIFTGIIYAYNQTYYDSSFLLTPSLSMFISGKINKYIRFHSFMYYGGGIDYFYSRIGKNPRFYISIDLTPFPFLQFDNSVSYSLFQTDTVNTILNYSELNNVSDIWKTVYFTSSLLLIPNNTYSLKFVFRNSYIDFTENYYPSYLYINDIQGNVINKNYQLFALFTYKPSLNNTVYLGVKYTFENENQIRNISKETLFFFKFIHKFFI